MCEKILFKKKEFEVVENCNFSYENSCFKTIVVTRKGKKFFLDIFKQGFEDELWRFKKIKRIMVPAPKLLKVDKEKQMTLRTYHEGVFADKLLAEQKFKDEDFKSLFYTYRIMRANKLNLSYAPHDYILTDKGLIYLNSTVRDKSEEFDFEKEPIRLWFPTVAGRAYLKSRGFDISKIQREEENYWNKKIVLISIQYW